ncbi:reprolysin-like metallopeptidase [Panacibacter ginsenosidivorans]|nr:zinc-dependent metalloprotease family protein [Panacibacter ginsenosidivorans]
MKKLLLLSLVCGGFMMSVHAQNDKALWKPTAESALSQKAKDEFGKHFKPAAYKFFSLKEDDLRNDLITAPAEKSIVISKSGKFIAVPDAEGNMQRFRIAEVPVMAPQLAAKYPGVKTYIGQGVEDKTATIHFDVTPAGFHAVVMSASKPTYYINPVDNANKVYIVNARNPGDKSAGFKCDIDKSLLITSNGSTDKSSTVTGNADDGKLRTYDLALCVNGEFSQTFLDGSETNDAQRIAKVMNVLITCIVRANAVYERDFGIRLQYVANEDTLIFLDPATDPWPTKPPLFGTSWNSKTQQTIDARIGSANYDVGHLLGKVPTFGDNNGNAGCIGCVCTSGAKGSGFSAYYDPTLIDYMVIDYWTHEMGHQFGANHTFDFSSEGTQAQIEPGSGSTIMGYAGITGSTDIQPHSDDLFSVVSIAQVANNIKSGSSSTCPAITNTGNTAPLANAGADYTIPKSTPFILTGTGSDIDGADALTYIWEQADVFEKTTSNTFPSATSTTGPVFRVYNDSTLPVRVFPALSTILAGQTSSTWEALPSVARDLSFRFTVRDNHVGGGNNMTDEMKVTVASTAGPFVVTQPNTNVSWVGGSQQTITWDVAATNNAPVSCANVKISLSTDGGNTFNTVLAASTPNDGSQVVTLPSVNSTQCRIKVEAVGNIFFDISNANFTISGGGPACPGQYDTNNNNKPQTASVIPLNTDVYGTIGVSGDKDFYRFTITTDGTINITLTNVPADYDITLINSSNTIIGQSRKKGTTDESISTTVIAGDYAVRVTAKNGVFDAANCYTLKVATGTASLGIAAASADAVSSKVLFKIYPNPVTSTLYINLPSSSLQHEIKVYDVNGKVVAMQKATQQLVQINLSRIVAGVYYVKVINSNGKEVYASSFIKQ